MLDLGHRHLLLHVPLRHPAPVPVRLHLGQGPGELRARVPQPEHLQRGVLRPARPGLLPEDPGPGRPAGQPRLVRPGGLARLGQLPVLGPDLLDEPDLPDEVPQVVLLQPADGVRPHVRHRRPDVPLARHHGRLDGPPAERPLERAHRRVHQSRGPRPRQQRLHPVPHPLRPDLHGLLHPLQVHPRDQGPHEERGHRGGRGRRALGGVQAGASPSTWPTSRPSASSSPSSWPGR